MTNDEIIASGDDSEINKQILEYEKRMNKFIKDLIKNQEDIIKNLEKKDNG